MLMLSFALLALAGGSVQSAPQSRAEAGAPAGAPASAPAQQAEPRQVCRLETVIGSNRRTRVCRTVTNGAQDQQTREYMRDSQRVRVPDSN
jgi:hypothetical protein